MLGIIHALNQQIEQARYPVYNGGVKTNPSDIVGEYVKIRPMHKHAIFKQILQMFSKHDVTDINVKMHEFSGERVISPQDLGEFLPLACECTRLFDVYG